MRYKIINKYTILQVTTVIDPVNGLTTNASDELIDFCNAGYPLDDTATPPEYNPDTQTLKVVYTEVENVIVKGYEVEDIIPSELDLLKQQVTDLAEKLGETTSTESTNERVDIVEAINEVQDTAIVDLGDMVDGATDAILDLYGIT